MVNKTYFLLGNTIGAKYNTTHKVRGSKNSSKEASHNKRKTFLINKSWVGFGNYEAYFSCHECLRLNNIYILKGSSTLLRKFLIYWYIIRYGYFSYHRESDKSVSREEIWAQYSPSTYFSFHERIMKKTGIISW